MTPLDRAALADALASATAETLKADAELMMQMVNIRIEKCGLDEWARAWQTSASLLLAVAAMEEQNLGVTIPDDVAPYNRGVYMRYDFTTVAEAPSLPAALAALLKGDQ